MGIIKWCPFYWSNPGGEYAKVRESKTEIIADC